MDNPPVPRKTTRTPICMLGVALVMSRAPGSRHATAADTRDEVGQGAQPAVLRVGAARELKRPSAAAQIARDGDVIEIDAGIYAGDAAVWRQHRLTIRGLGGPPQLRADRAPPEGQAIWSINGYSPTIPSLAFSHPTVPAPNCP